MYRIFVISFLFFGALKNYGQDSLRFFLPKMEWQILDTSKLEKDIPSNYTDFIIYSEKNACYYLCKSGFNVMNNDSTVILAIESVNVYRLKLRSPSGRGVMKLIWNESLFKRPKKLIRIKNFNLSEDQIVLNNKVYYRFPQERIHFSRPTKILKI